MPNKKKVGVKEFANEKIGNVYRIIVSFEPSKNKWYGTNLKTKLDKKINEIDKWFQDRLNKKMWRSRDKVETKMINLISTKFAPYIEYSIVGEDGPLQLEYGIKETEVDHYFKKLGKSYFMTNLDEISPQDIIWKYRQQYTVERAFKYIKNHNFLSIRPMFHYNDDSIRGHVFSCVLGLTLLSLLHRNVVTKFPWMSMGTMVDELKNSKIIRVHTGNTYIEKIIPDSDGLTELLKFLNYEKYLQ